MRLLVITPRLDPNDDLFGHVHTWVAALARRVDRLYVVALWARGPSAEELPANVRFGSLGKGRTDDKVFWLARLQRLAGRLLLRGEVDAVLAHMAPTFAVAAAPLARLAGRPLFLWYAHGHVSPMLRVAHALVDGVGTSTPEGFRIPSSKVTITGQGIDVERFTPAPSPPVGQVTLLSVGRFSPVKDVDTLLQAYARLANGNQTTRLEVIGGVHSKQERSYLDALRMRVAQLRLGERVHFVEGLPHRNIVPSYQRATLFASCSRTGGLDKAVLEAASCGLVPIVCNTAFKEFLGPHWSELGFPVGDAAVLADRISDWLARDPGERRALGLWLRAKVSHQHSVDHLADAILRMVGARTG